jgi:hypothetical protein
MSVVSLAAQSVKLAWNTYPTNDPSVTTIKIYGIKENNAVFAADNSNATLLSSVPATNNISSISNLAAGWWTFTATAYSTNGMESLNSNTVWTNILPDRVTNLRFGS